MKKLTAISLALVLLISLAVPAFAFTAVLSPQKLAVDGKQIDCEKYNIDGSNYFKLRDLARLLNGTGSQFDVGWDETNKVVSVTTNHAYTTPNGHELEVGADKSGTAVVSTQTIMIDGRVRSDLAVYNIGGSNFFKLREMGDALGFDVDYDGTTNTAIVRSRGGQAPAPQPGGRTELSPEQIYARCMPAVFYIEVYDDYGDAIASGSGFFIDAEGTAVTNHHVIYGASSAKVMLADSSGADREILDVLGVYDWSEEEDWAVLKVDCTGNSYLKIGDPSTAAGGAAVYALGSPLGLSASISDGIISNPARVVDGQTYIQISAPISHGSSGGALVNKYGEVIGITSAGFDEGQNLNLAIPIGKIANAKHGGLTPIGETYVMPGGNIYTDYTLLTLRPGETFDVVVTATKYNTDALLNVNYYFIDDEDSEPTTQSDLVRLESDTWYADSDHYTLHITALDKFGTTTLALVLSTQDNDEFLDVAYLTLTVSGGELTLASESMTVDVGGSGTMEMTAVTNDGRMKQVRYFIEDSSIVSCSWGEWTNGNRDIALTVNGLACGSTSVTLKLVDADNWDIVLAEAVFFVTVVDGKLVIDKPEIVMAPGESATVTITGTPNDPGVHATIHADEWGSDVIDWQRGALGSGTVQLTVTALAEGWDCIYITLEDDEGTVLADGWIDVYVTMDGKGEDEDEIVLPQNGAMKLAIGETVFTDLNGDGAGEEVRLWLTGDGDGGGDRVRLSIGGTDYTDALYALVRFFDLPDDSFWAITDLDASDGKLEIAIQDWGPSDDLTTRFIRFDGVSFTDVGCVEGFLFHADGSAGATVLGGGKVSSYMRLSVFQTWWAQVVYATGADGKLSPVPQDFYVSTFDDQQTTLQHAVYAHDMPDPFQPSREIPAGTTARIVGTDNVQWVKLLLADGSECWVQLVGYGYQVETPDGLLYTAEVFSDLLMAD